MYCAFTNAYIEYAFMQKIYCAVHYMLHVYVSLLSIPMSWIWQVFHWQVFKKWHCRPLRLQNSNKQLCRMPASIHFTLSPLLAPSLSTHVENYWFVSVCLCKPRRMHTIAHPCGTYVSTIICTACTWICLIVLIFLTFQTLSLWPCSAILPTFRPFAGSFPCSFGMSKKVLARSGIERCRGYPLAIGWMSLDEICLYSYVCVYVHLTPRCIGRLKLTWCHYSPRCTGTAVSDLPMSLANLDNELKQTYQVFGPIPVANSRWRICKLGKQSHKPWNTPYIQISLAKACYHRSWTTIPSTSQYQTAGESIQAEQLERFIDKKYDKTRYVPCLSWYLAGILNESLIFKRMMHAIFAWQRLTIGKISSIL